MSFPNSLHITTEERTGVSYLHISLSCYTVRSRRAGPPIRQVRTSCLEHRAWLIMHAKQIFTKCWLNSEKWRKAFFNLRFITHCWVKTGEEVRLVPALRGRHLNWKVRTLKEEHHVMFTVSGPFYVPFFQYFVTIKGNLRLGHYPNTCFFLFYDYFLKPSNKCVTAKNYLRAIQCLQTAWFFLMLFVLFSFTVFKFIFY